MDARKIDKVDRAVPCSMLNNGGEAANYLSIARGSDRSAFVHCRRMFSIV